MGAPNNCEIFSIVLDLVYLPLERKERKGKRRKVAKRKKTLLHHRPLAPGYKSSTWWTMASMRTDWGLLWVPSCAWRCSESKFFFFHLCMSTHLQFIEAKSSLTVIYFIKHFSFTSLKSTTHVTWLIINPLLILVSSSPLSELRFRAQALRQSESSEYLHRAITMLESNAQRVS